MKKTTVNAEAGILFKGGIVALIALRGWISFRLDLGQSTWEWKAGLSGRQLYSGEILI